MKHITLSAFTFFAPILAFAAPIPMPEGVQAGSNYLWFVASGAKKAPETFVLSHQRDFQTATSKVARGLKSWTNDIESNVYLIHQSYLTQGEERTIFSLYSRSKGSRYFEVHVLGKNKPPLIAGVREMKYDDVIRVLAQAKIIKIPQK